jgi:hypothetical protein
VSAKDEGQDELFARRCVEGVLRVQVDRWDAPGRDGAVDCLIRYPGREPAALEITTLTDQATRELVTLLSKPLPVEPKLYAWRVTPYPGTSMKELRRHVPRLIELCEAAGVTDPDNLDPVENDPAMQWFDAAPVEIAGYPTNGQPSVQLLRPPISGATKDSLSALAQALGPACEKPLVVGKIDKLKASKLEECHLFLFVDDSGLPFGPYYALAIDQGIPLVVPDVPADVSDVWMASGYQLGGVLRWCRESGWSRHWPFDEVR